MRKLMMSSTSVESGSDGSTGREAILARMASHVAIEEQRQAPYLTHAQCGDQQ